MSVNRSVSPPCGSAIARHYRDRFRSCRRAWRTPPRSATCAMWRCRYATDHGIELHELRKVRRDGTVETLHGRLLQPGSRSLPIPVRCPTQAPPAPAPTLCISRSGSLAAGSASTAPAGPTPPPSPSGTPPTKSTAPTANAPNRGKPPTTRYLSSGCPGPTARPSLPAPDFPCPAQRLLLLSLPPVWHLGEDAPRRTGLVRPGRG